MAVGVLKTTYTIIKASAIERCITSMLCWMFLGPAPSVGLCQINNSVPGKDVVEVDDPQPPPAKTLTPAQLARTVRTLIGYTEGALPPMSAEPFFQGQRNNCTAISLLTVLQWSHRENYLALLQQLCDRGALHFCVDGHEVNAPVNLTGNFAAGSTDRSPHELLAATIMQASQPALTEMIQADLAEFSRQGGVHLSENFQEIFHPELQWNQNLGIFKIRREIIDKQLRDLGLSKR
ncbi:MAG: hypothetical protein LBF26_03585, partial [Puniceicoccales bacterium]|nr:hypothetical protein [Puniceicoccales bacterium]